MLGLLMGVGCWAFGSGDPNNFADQACTLAKLPNLLQQFYEQVSGLFETEAWGFGADSCDEAIKKADEIIKAHDDAEAEQEGETADEDEGIPTPLAPGEPLG